MSLDWFNKIKKVTVDNSIYQILQIKNIGNSQTEIDFLWGKIDFKAVGKVNDDHFQIEKLQIKRNGEWYDYRKISSHGIFNEETQWKNQHRDVFIELPAKFYSVPEKLFRSFQNAEIAC